MTESKNMTRRRLLQVLGIGSGAAATLTAASSKLGNEDLRMTMLDALGDMFQNHFKRMDKNEVQETLARMERKYAAQYQKDIKVSANGALPNTRYGYALNLSKCKGYRACVQACVAENNQSRDSEIQYIRVVELPHGTYNLEHGNH